MSWNIHKSGKRINVMGSIATDEHIPSSVKAGLDMLLVAFPERHYTVESYGHIDSQQGNLTLTIKPTESM